MRTWNFNSLDSLEEQVLVTGTAGQHKVEAGKHAGNRRNRSMVSSPLQMVLSVAALAAVTMSLSLSSNSSRVRLSAPTSTIAANVRTERPPLDLLFGGRFTSDWTQELEKQLLNSAAEKAFGTPDEDRQNLIHTAQQESLSDDVPRLKADAVLRISGRRG